MSKSETLTSEISVCGRLENLKETATNVIENKIDIAEDSQVETIVKKENEKEPQFDFSLVVVGTLVKHKKFGIGKIVNIDKAHKYIHIKFDAGEKTFIFSAFTNGHLEIA